MQYGMQIKLQGNYKPVSKQIQEDFYEYFQLLMYDIQVIDDKIGHMDVLL